MDDTECRKDCQLTIRLMPGTAHWQLLTTRGVRGDRVLDTGTKEVVRAAAQAYLDRHQLREVRTYYDGNQYKEIIEACYAPPPPQDYQELIARLVLLEEERVAARGREERLSVRVGTLEERFVTIGTGVRTIIGAFRP